MTMSVRITNTSSSHTGVVSNTNGSRSVIAPGESVDVNVWVGGNATISEQVDAGGHDGAPVANAPPHKLLRYFAFTHLPAHLQAVSKPFSDAAHALAGLDVVDEAERTVALRKLLESKDAAVRSVIPQR